ncbi:MAG TPA: hypothetical protein DHV16_09260 [Nitrospiraceae bacterium]|nr:MAG: hypothetical protein A2Z82_01015 [Nitrospirae bacterium GWA2_46_11]OGW25487.1 MAG: hypothetical protein A2X55_03245 [Nitrospirae bacterium GWB2_47_37]HAK87589.1 hypothetical protein [Nitrospiraceae bacterium]HCZ12417.1 hypothetical protein [Nitrospiraceae bacterium]
MALPKNIEWIWPSIVDTTTAQKASKQGLWASAWCAGATIVFVVLAQFGSQMFNFDSSALLDAFLFIIIGWGIYKMNRIAAVAGLALYIIERLYMWSASGPKNPAIAIFITLMFINSIRGIFAYHKIKKAQI